MIYPATKLIAEAFEKEDLKYHIEESPDGKTSRVTVVHAPKIGAPAILHFINSDSDCDFSLRVFQFYAVDPSSKKQMALAKEIVNEFNNQYRYLKATVDSDGDINLEYDLVCANEELLGGMAISIYRKTAGIIRSFMPTMIKKLYGGTIASDDLDDPDDD